jgi:hypothetical protein
MEFKSLAEWSAFLKGNEAHIASKMKAGKFELVSCTKCYSKFDSQKHLDIHMTEKHESKPKCLSQEDGQLVDCSTSDKDTAAKYDDLSKEGGPGYQMGISCFKKGGDVYN